LGYQIDESTPVTASTGASDVPNSFCEKSV
jgi:hypothetical protein